MRKIWDARQLQHAPAVELHNGGFVPHAEHPGRAQSILAAIGVTEPASDHGEAPILRVHSHDYVRFLKCAYSDWKAAGRPGDATGYTWPVVRRRPIDLERIDARLGQYSYDAGTPIAEGSWTGAYWSAQTALTALDLILAGERSAFAFCRPPGHHAGTDYLGGYCYLNNAAIAAQAAVDAGAGSVAILDIDYHHGNGTQDIFYDRGDILFVSIHADPKNDYPFFWGHADETGEGAGEGANLNIPLHRGTALAEFESALESAMECVRTFAPELLILSFGADTFSGDPISFFKLETKDYPIIARRIERAALPTLVVMEGGYAVDDLGGNVAAFLSGFGE